MLNSETWISYIERSLVLHSDVLKNRARSNRYDGHKDAEHFYRRIFNVLLSLKLEAADIPGQKLQEGIDLVDDVAKVVVSVSGQKRKSKIQHGLNKDLSKYSGYKFMFMSIVHDASSHRDKTFDNPHDLAFNPAKDIWDIPLIIEAIRGFEADEINKVVKIYTYVKWEFDEKIANRIHYLSDEAIDRLLDSIVNQVDLSKGAGVDIESIIQITIRRFEDFLSQERNSYELKNLLEQGLLKEAEEYVDSFDSSLEKERKTLSLKFSEKGDVKRLIFKYDEAVSAYKEAYTIFNDLNYLNNAAELALETKNIELASDILSPAKSLSEDDLDNRTLNNLGGVEKIRGNIKDAARYVSILVNRPNLNLNELVTYSNSYAVIEIDFKRYRAAIKVLKNVLDIALREPAVDSKIIPLLYKNMSIAYINNKQFDAAREALNVSLEYCYKLFGNDPHPLIAQCLNDIGYYHSGLNNKKEAKKYYRKAIGMYDLLYGKYNPRSIVTYLNVASIEDDLKHHYRSIQITNACLKYVSLYFGDTSEDMARAYNNVTRSYIAAGNNPKAIECAEKTLQICLKLFGNKHDRTVYIRNILASLQ